MPARNGCIGGLAIARRWHGTTLTAKADDDMAFLRARTSRGSGIAEGGGYLLEFEPTAQQWDLIS